LVRSQTCLFAEFLNRFREFSEPLISPLVELPVKRRDEGDSQGAADNRDEVQPGSDCPFSDLPASDRYLVLLRDLTGLTGPRTTGPPNLQWV
jgi:hypothetical protein